MVARSQNGDHPCCPGGRGKKGTPPALYGDSARPYTELLFGFFAGSFCSKISSAESSLPTVVIDSRRL